MLGYLLDAYRLSIYNMQNRRIKDFTKKEIVLFAGFIIVGIFFCIVTIFFFETPLLYTISFALLIIVGVALGSIMIKDSRRNYSNNLQEYLTKLEELKKLIEGNEFKIDKESKLDKLISICEERLKDTNLSYKLFQPLITVFTKTIIPIVAFIFGTLVEKMSTSSILEYSILLIVFIIYFTGIFYIVYPSIECIINKEKYILKSLRDELVDIKLKYYIQ